MRIFRKLGIETSDGSIFDNRDFAMSIQVLTKSLPMYVRGLWWKLWLKETSGLILIGKHVSIRNPQKIIVGANFVAEDYCEIQGASEKGIKFGNKVVIGRYAVIRPSGYYGRKLGVGLSIGDRSNIGNFGYIGCSGGIRIGSNVLMSPRVSLFAENHIHKRLDIPIKDQGVIRKSISIEDDCWLASHCVVLSGVTIGKGAIVAAGAVVNKDVPSYSIAAGIPAEIIGWRRNESDLKSKSEQID